MIIYVFDERWNVGPLTAYHPKKKVAIVRVGRNEAMSSVVAKIWGEGTKEPVELMRLCAHGNCGMLMMGTGFGLLETTLFTPIADLFSETDKLIEIHGCGVASDTSILNNKGRIVPGSFNTFDEESSPSGVGYQFMQSLAVHANCNVKAGINVQYMDRSFRYEGATITVTAGGSWAPGTR